MSFLYVGRIISRESRLLLIARTFFISILRTKKGLWTFHAVSEHVSWMGMFVTQTMPRMRATDYALSEMSVVFLMQWCFESLEMTSRYITRFCSKWDSRVWEGETYKQTVLSNIIKLRRRNRLVTWCFACLISWGFSTSASVPYLSFFRPKLNFLLLLLWTANVR
jgi:hypothetical protein